MPILAGLNGPSMLKDKVLLTRNEFDLCSGKRMRCLKKDGDKTVRYLKCKLFSIFDRGPWLNKVKSNLTDRAETDNR